MGARTERDSEYDYCGRPVSALGFKLRAMREQIEAAAARGETKLLNHRDLELELQGLRESDPDVR